MESGQKQNISFYRKIKISLALMGILPFLLVAYLFSRGEQAPNTLMILASALILFSILLGFTLLRKSSDQMQSLAKRTAIPDSGTLPEPINLNVDGELQDIAGNFNSIVEQLNQAKQDIQSRGLQLQKYADDLARTYELLEKENRLREKLCRYVEKDLVEKLMVSGDGQLLRNERKDVTIMFADIRSFTAISEYMEPEEVVAMLNEFFSVMTDILFKHGGMLDKFVGDQIMAVFGHISSEKEGARSAVLAAMEMQKATMALMRNRIKTGHPIFQVGIGINTGSAILASVGAKNRQDYTVIGDTVNTTARLEKLALGREIVIGERTKSHLPKSIHLSDSQKLKLRNRSLPITCYVLRPARNKPPEGAKKTIATPSPLSSAAVS